MAATALIQLTQSSNVGIAGQALFGVAGVPVLISGSNSGVQSWQVDLLYSPSGSAILTGTLAFHSASALTTASFTPSAGIGGAYRIRLQVWDAINKVGTATDTDIRNFGIREPNGLYVPAPQIFPRPLPPVASGETGNKPDENNFGGQLNGWAGIGSDGLMGDTIRYVVPFALPRSGGTMTGSITFSGSDILNVRNITGKIYDLGDSGNSKNVDFNSGSFQTLQVNVPTASITFTTPSDGNVSSIILAIMQDPSGSRTYTFPSNLVYSNGRVPVYSTGAGTIDYYFMKYTGTVTNTILASAFLNPLASGGLDPGTSGFASGSLTGSYPSPSLAYISPGAVLSGSLLTRAIAAPVSPTGAGVIYQDSGSLALCLKTTAGSVTHTVATSIASSTLFLTGINDDGTVTRACPVFSDISGTLPLSQLTSSFPGGALVFNGSGLPTVVTGSVGQALVSNGSATPSFQNVSGSSGGGGTVTGIVPIISGGTGQGNAAAGFSALTTRYQTIPIASQVSLTGGLLVHVSGSGTISSFAAESAGVFHLVVYEGGAPIFVYNSSSLILLGGQSRTGSSGDAQLIVSDASGSWRELFYGVAAAAPATAGLNCQLFTVTGSNIWIKPPNAVMVDVYEIGGGGPGASGRRGAAGTNRGGGGGGGGGSTVYRRFPADILGSFENVNVGIGGTGAAGITSDDTDGGAGSGHTSSSFGTILSLVAGRGRNGSAGTTTGGAGGTSDGISNAGSALTGRPGAAGGTGVGGSTMSGTVGGITAVGTVATDYMAAGSGGGGGGGGISSANVTEGGGPGGSGALNFGSTTPASGSGNPGAAGTDGGAGIVSRNIIRGGGGGGGGSSGASNNGGNGGYPGGGGGGGGASLNGTTSGRGGNGANGVVLAITYLGV